MAVDDLGWTLLKLLAVVGLVLLNGFFVAAEFAIVKVRATQLATRLERGDHRAKRAQHVVEHLDAYLSATQLGITLASLGLGWIGEPAVATLIEPAVHAMGVTNPTVLHTIAFSISFGIITFLHIVVGELAPKSLAIQRAEGVTIWTAGPLRVFRAIFAPFIWSLNGLANRLLALFGVRPASEGEMVQSEEELRLLLADAGARRALAKHRADVILGMFKLGDLQARQVMTPRGRMFVLDAARSFEENLAAAEESGYSRYPIIQRELDNVLGMVHYRDLMTLARSAGARRDITSIKRSVLMVPETKSAEDLLREMLSRGVHMAVVTDEYGSVAGIVTLEDIFEELFGEIRDEFDTAESDQYRTLGEGHYVLEGILPLHQAANVLGLDLTDPDVTTLSGYIVGQLGRLPVKGERFELGPYDGVVRDVDRRRIHSVEVKRRPPEDAEPVE